MQLRFTPNPLFKLITQVALVHKETIQFWSLFIIFPVVWWVCDCRSKRVSGTDNSPTLSGKFFRVSSFTFNLCNTKLTSDGFSKGAVICIRYPRSEFALTLVASFSRNAFFDLIANSILRATILSRAVKIAFWILLSTVSTMLLSSLSFFALKHLSKAFTSTVFSLFVKLLPEVPTVKSRSPVLSLTKVISCLSLAVLLLMISWSKSSNWLRDCVFYCLFLRV